MTKFKRLFVKVVLLIDYRVVKEGIKSSEVKERIDIVFSSSGG